MKKTLFAGVTILEPGEPLSADNGAYTGRDREAIDHFLELGAKTHRHNGLAGLSNPTGAPEAEVVASGGSIGAGLALSLGFTEEDAQGGETMLSPLTVVSTPPPLSGPVAMPSAVADYSAGELLVNTYFYALTWTDGEGGETPLGPAVTVERRPGDAKGRVQLSALAYGMATASAAGWRLYRAVGGAAFSLLATGTPAEDTFTDDGTHSLQCDIHPPAGEINTTRGVSTLVVTVPFFDGEFVNIYASVTGDFSGGSLLARYPQASAGASVAFPAIELLPVSPPPVNRSVGGANKIDPDTELIDWHWKRPVENITVLFSLPDSEKGDVRFVLGTGEPWYYNGSSWHKWTVEGGGGSGSTVVYASGGHPGEVGALVEDSFSGAEMDPNWIANSVGEEEEKSPDGLFLHLDGSGKLLKGASGEEAEATGGGEALRKDAVGINGRQVTLFGATEAAPTFANFVGHVMRAQWPWSTFTGGPRCIVAGYQGPQRASAGNGNLVIELYHESETHTLAELEITNGLPIGEFYLVSEIQGALITVWVYEGDPESGGVVLHEVSHSLHSSVEFISDAEQEDFIGLSGFFGLEFAGAPGGYVKETLIELTGAPVDYVASAGAIEFVPGPGVTIAVTESPAGTAQVAIETAGGMGYVFCEEDLTKDRPAYAGVTWVTTGGGEEPENMVNGDILLATGEGKQFVKVAGSLVEV